MAAPGPGEDPSLDPGQRAADGGGRFSDLPRRRTSADAANVGDDSVPWDETEREAVGRAEEVRRQAEREELDRLLAERNNAIERAEADERAAFAGDAARAERGRYDRGDSDRTDVSDAGSLRDDGYGDGSDDEYGSAYGDGAFHDDGFDNDGFDNDGFDDVGFGDDEFAASDPISIGRPDFNAADEYGTLDDREGGVSRSAAGAGVSDTSAVRSGTITVVPKVAGELETAAGPTTSKLGWLVTLALVGLALALAVTLFRILGGGDDESTQDDAQQEETEVEAGQLRTPLEIFPQRAVVGESLAVASKGAGCAANSTGILTIRAVDDGLADPAGRLIAQRTVRVGGDGTWESTPRLVGAKAGTYWLTSTCVKDGGSGTLSVAVQNGSQGDVVELLRTSDPQQILEATQVLEITGPVDVLAVNLTPEVALAGTPTNVLLQGDQCAGARVDGVATGPNGERITYVATVDGNGAWNVSVPLPATATVGSYRFVSRCDTGEQYATRTVAFVAERVPTVRDATTSGTVSVSTPTLEGIPLAQPATPIPADANFTG